MSANGDADKPVWLTEIGWSSYQGTCRDGAGAGTKPAGVGEDNQAAYLLQAMHCARVRDMTWLQKAILFVLNEAPDPDPMNTGYGIVRQDGSLKPAFNAWKSYATAGDQIPDSEQCGDFASPTIHLTTPTSGGQFVGALPISVSADDPSGVPRISLFVDGKTEIRNFTDAKAPQTLDGALTWQGAKKLSLGPHKITVTALDIHGNVGSSTVDVVKVDPSKLKAIKTKIVTTLTGTGGRRTVSIRVAPSAVGLTSLLGKINVVAQKRRGKKWVSAHSYSKSAKGSDKKALTFKLKLEKAQWRIVVRYRPKAGTSYKGTTRVLKTFRV
jgi:hypothetical protein